MPLVFLEPSTEGAVTSHRKKESPGFRLLSEPSSPKQEQQGTTTAEYKTKEPRAAGLIPPTDPRGGPDSVDCKSDGIVQLL